MKSYAAVLAKMVSNSGKTLREISDECKELGVTIDPSYISRLQTGKQAPASDEVNAAIAKVCEIDPDELLIAAYSEKAPAFIQTFVNRTAEYLRALADEILRNKFPQSLAENMFLDLGKMGDWDLVYHIINEPNYEVESLSSLIDLDRDKNTFSFTAPDASLVEIPLGSKMLVSKIQITEDLREGDYVLVALPDRSHLVRRLMRCGNEILLLADNAAYESFTLDEESIQIIGKVVFIEPFLFKQ